jgi:phosphate-selective porin OprO/OprP
VASALAFVALSRTAAAQSDYYQEVTKEGRIYVFSTAEGQKAWESSGEIGNKAVSRLGYGPNGETVMFEDAKAIEAYNAKHGQTEAPPKEVKASDVKLPFDVKWRAPGTRFTFPKFELNWSNRIQIRATQEDPEVTAGQADRLSFRIRRLRLKFDGWAFTKNLTYEVQVSLHETGAATSNSLEDANIDYDFTDGKRAFRLKAGQYKVPFGRQELTSSGSQQFVDRSIVSGEFARGRDIGVQLWGQAGSPAIPDFVEWRVGAFNGAGRSVTRNTNDKLQYNARVMISPWGNAGYSESNLEEYPFRASFAVNFEDRDKVLRPATGDFTGDDRQTIGADISIKAARILSIFVEGFQQDRDNPAGVTTEWEGIHAQVGVFVIPTKLEIAGRYAELDPNTDQGDNEREETGIAFNYFWHRHNNKLQFDVRQIENKATDLKDKEYRLQYQLIF